MRLLCRIKPEKFCWDTVKMDIQLAYKLIKARNETFVPGEDHPQMNPMQNALSAVVSLAIALYAAYLSWSCSGMYPHALRVIFAVLAAMFGMTYIVLFAIMRADMCKTK